MTSAALLAAVILNGPELTSRQERLIDHVFQAWDEPDSPGMAVGVVKDGQFVYKKAFGSADLERETPLSPDHVFYVASVSKQFTATCILLLEEQGKLSIDDPVQKYIPELPEYEKPILIRHLLSHTSGVKDYYTLNGMRGMSTYDFYTDDEILSLITRQSSLNFEPGSEYLYSNSGYLLLKTIIERASGESIQAFSKKSIFDPLEMSFTRYQMGQRMLIPGRALAYSGSIPGGFSNVHSTDATVGTRGVLTTLDDFRKWHENFKKNRLGKGSQKMIDRLKSVTPLTSGRPTSYALGLTVSPYKGLTAIGHGGSFAGYKSSVLLYPEQNTSVFVFSNHSSVSAGGLADQVSDILLEGQFKPETPKKPRKPKPVDTVAPADLIRLNGFYQNRLGFVWQVGQSFNRLGVIVNDEVRMTLIPEGEDRFYDAESGSEVEFSKGGKMTITPMEGVPSVLYLKPPIEYKTEDLKKFVGRYYSRDLDAWNEIYLKNGRLRAKSGHRDYLLTATPIGEFRSGFGRIAFNETGFSLHGSRVRRIDFIKG